MLAPRTLLSRVGYQNYHKEINAGSARVLYQPMSLTEPRLVSLGDTVYSISKCGVTWWPRSLYHFILCACVHFMSLPRWLPGMAPLTLVTLHGEVTFYGTMNYLCIYL